MSFMVDPRHVSGVDSSTPGTFFVTFCSPLLSPSLELNCQPLASYSWCSSPLSSQRLNPLFTSSCGLHSLAPIVSKLNSPSLGCTNSELVILSSCCPNNSLFCPRFTIFYSESSSRHQTSGPWSCHGWLTHLLCMSGTFLIEPIPPKSTFRAGLSQCWRQIGVRA